MATNILLDCGRGPLVTNDKYPGANRKLYPDDAVVGESKVAAIFPISENTLTLLRANGDGPPYLHDQSHRNGDFYCYRIGEIREWISWQLEWLSNSLAE